MSELTGELVIISLLKEDPHITKMIVDRLATHIRVWLELDFGRHTYTTNLEDTPATEQLINSLMDKMKTNMPSKKD